MVSRNINRPTIRTLEHPSKIGYSVITLGPPPASGLGGISEALPAYHEAILMTGASCVHIDINNPRIRGGRCCLWIRQIPLIAKTILSSKQRGLKTILYAHPGGGYSLIRSGILLAVGRILGAKTVLQLHAGETFQYLHNNFQKIFLKILLKGTQNILVLTPWWKELLQRHNVNQEINVIPNPVSQALLERGDQFLKSRLSSNLAVESIVILIMTRLVPGKGIRATVSALSLLPKNYSLLIAGTGPLQKELEDIVEQLRIRDRVQFTGWSSGQQRYQMYEKAHIYCMPTYIDSFGMGFIEAMAFGLPVIGYRWGPISDIIIHQQVGLLVENRTAGAISDAITKLGNASYRLSMGKQGNQLVRNAYSSHIVYQKLFCLFNSIARD